MISQNNKSECIKCLLLMLMLMMTKHCFDPDDDDVCHQSLIKIIRAFSVVGY